MNIRKKDLLYLSYGILIFLFIGIYWWSLPYNELNMEDAFVQWSIFLVVASFVFRFFFQLNTQKTIYSTIIGIVMVIIVRFFHDFIKDTSTHNLVLLEVIIAILIGGLSSISGVFLANQFVRKNEDNKDTRSKAEIENTKKQEKNKDT
ncbi:MAG: hypothetical protein ACNS60_01020 [Candidatus Cyclobacteriaceae bacterium M2_1C_046]